MNLLMYSPSQLLRRVMKCLTTHIFIYVIATKCKGITFYGAQLKKLQKQEILLELLCRKAV